MTPVIPMIETPPEAPGAMEHIDLHQYWRTVKKHQRPILGIVLLAALFSTLIVFALTPVYRSTVTLLIEVSPAKVVSIEEVYGANLANREYLESQYEILKSRTIAEKVIDRWKLAQSPEFGLRGKQPWYVRWFGADPGPQDRPLTAEERENLFKAVKDRLAIEPVRRTQLIKISFDAHDPGLAADIANAVAQAYIESNLEARVQMTQKASAWLAERLEELQTKQVEGEKALKEYVAKQPLSAFESLPEVLNQPTIQRLKEAESEAMRKISELSKQYGPAHPKMLSVKDELATVRNSIAREIRTITNSLAEYDTDRTGRTGQKDARLDAANPLQKTARLHALQREVIANRQLYNLFLDRIKETRLLGDTHTTNARVVDPALPAIKPAKPRKALVIGLAVLLALFAALLLAFLLEYLENTLKTASDVEAKLGLPTLGILPDLAAKGANNPKITAPEKAFLQDNSSTFAEAVRTIRTGVMLSALDEPHKIVLVTSSVQGEGKTTVSMNLALALAHLEPKALLIDADMRKPNVGRNFDLAPEAPGLSNLVAGTATERECIHKTKDGLDILPSGIIPPNPLELLSSRRFAELLHQLSGRYSRIVIDSAPVNEVSDALILATLASAVVFVAKADATPHQVAHVALKRLRAAKAPVIGVVLSMVDIARLARWDAYSGYSSYYSHYGYGRLEDVKTRAVG